MAIQSWGYPGTFAPGPVWADLQLGIGRRYMVENQAALVVTAVAAGTRQISISDGYAAGWGVVDLNDAPYVLALPAVTSGTKWFMVVLRRTHGTTNETTFAYIDAGTTGSTVLPARNTTRGVLDDQPIAMVPLTAGDTVPGTPIDLRVMGTDIGDLHARSDLVLQYTANLGVRVHINGTTWTRALNAAGTGQVWLKESGPQVATQSAVIVTESGWSGTNLLTEAVVDGYQVQLDVDIRRTGARVVPDANGGLADLLIATISAPYRPTTKEVPFAFKYFGGAVADSFFTAMGLGTLQPGGNLYINQLSAGEPLNQRGSTDFSSSVRAHITFTRKI